MPSSVATHHGGYVLAVLHGYATSGSAFGELAELLFLRALHSFQVYRLADMLASSTRFFVAAV